MTYAFPPGGLPGQDVMPDGRAVFTDAYAFIPADTMRDIVTSFLPGWQANAGLDYRATVDRLCRDLCAMCG